MHDKIYLHNKAGTMYVMIPAAAAVDVFRSPRTGSEQSSGASRTYVVPSASHRPTDTGSAPSRRRKWQRWSTTKMTKRYELGLDLHRDDLAGRSYEIRTCAR